MTTWTPMIATVGLILIVKTIFLRNIIRRLKDVWKEENTTARARARA